MNIRILRRQRELEQASRLEAEVWGADDPTPPALLTVFAHHGGLVLGAYNVNQLVGISLGFPGLDHDGTTYLHSHLLAVQRPYRGQGMGAALKNAQREYARSRGLPYVGWTYDPLVSANAWFNLGVLGARVVELQHNVYGNLDDALNRGLPTHRFWVVWDTDSHPVRAVFTGEQRVMPIPAASAEWRKDNPAMAREQWERWFGQAQRWWDDRWRIAGVTKNADGVSYQWVRLAEKGGDAVAD